ncbi:hypothetical protein AUR64_17690 [Haloprofundus marisrubri]|uniref:Uncharacterized protein n=1 Tax=Haloprofundus marisrubri TaxID=1514971 RepID=A0A0W1R4Z5_9EURY|nr:hypothetical protein [Haloprofundus marisrubri]KTG08513.1 hypothetical protein AUR64_17690 [Haloprofundus marisrubri]
MEFTGYWLVFMMVIFLVGSVFAKTANQRRTHFFAGAALLVALVHSFVAEFEPMVLLVPVFMFVALYYGYKAALEREAPNWYSWYQRQD